MQNTQKLQAKPIAICFDAVALNLSNVSRPILLTRSQRNPLASDKATSQLVTRSSRHTVMSSHGQLVTDIRLITQSTRHKRAHNKTTSTSRPHLHAISLRRHPETVLNTDGVITAICVTLMICLFVQGQKVHKNVYCRFQITATDYTSTKSTVNSSQRRETRRSTRHTILRCDELTV